MFLVSGFIVNELVRRTDGRTVGQFVEDEITSVLNLSLQIGWQKSSPKWKHHVVKNRNEPEVFWYCFKHVSDSFVPLVFVLSLYVRSYTLPCLAFSSQERLRLCLVLCVRCHLFSSCKAYLLLSMITRILAGGKFGLKPMTKHMKYQIQRILDPSSYINRMFASVDWASFNNRDFPLSLLDRIVKTVAPQVWNSKMERLEAPLAREVEMPSCNGISNAQSLCLVAAAIVTGDSKALTSHISTDASMERVTKLLREIRHAGQLAMKDPVTKFDELTGCDTTFTRGGFNVFGAAFENENWDPSIQGFCGWGGYGGSMMAWDSEQEVAISYVMNGNLRSSFFGFDDPRCVRLMKAFRESVKSKPH
jgi:hypothetical protein